MAQEIAETVNPLTRPFFTPTIVHCLTCTLNQLKLDIGNLGLEGVDALLTFTTFQDAADHQTNNPTHVIIRAESMFVADTAPFVAGP